MMPHQDRLDSVQVLRAAAALAVTIAHTWVWVATACAQHGISNPVPGMVTGAAGVDLFFVISGFIMVYTTRNDPPSIRSSRRFFLRRLSRIAPLYWIAMATLALSWLDVGTSMKQEGIDVQTIIYSALFIFHQRPPPDNSLNPMLAQGWSLNYEMFFYLLFSVVLLFPRRLSIPVFIVALLTMGVMGHVGIVHGTFGRYFVYWLWEFAFGVGIGFAYSNGLRLPRSAAISCVVLGIVLLWSSTLYEPETYTWRPIHWGIPCAIILAGVVNLGQHLDVRWRAIVRIGDASYAQYLFHGMVMLWLFVHWPRIVDLLIKTVGPWGIVVYMTAMSVIVSVAIYVFVERSLLRTLRSTVAFVRPFGGLEISSPVKT
jgi:exopolysaccharide production protein ExoZ